jgi:hypothetical protein
MRADPDIVVTLAPPNKPATVLLKHVPYSLAIVVHEWGLSGAFSTPELCEVASVIQSTTIDMQRAVCFSPFCRR